MPSRQRCSHSSRARWTASGFIRPSAIKRSIRSWLVSRSPAIRYSVHPPIRRDGDLERRLAVDAVVGVEGAHRVADAVERELVGDDSLEGEEAAFHDAGGGDGVLVVLDA